MSISLAHHRSRGRSWAPRATVREVCLVGRVGPGSGPVEPGRTLTRGGRAYRVERSQPPTGGESRGYVHLAPAGPALA